jgi:arsenate reductase
MDKLKVLFVCTGNACRSQMAEGWVRYLKEERIEAYSAGVSALGLSKLAVRAMREAGVDISKQKSKTIGEVIRIPFDVVVTLCTHAQLNCPVFSRSVRTVHMEFPDPPAMSYSAHNEEEEMANYRKVRDAIREFVEGMPDNLLSA